MTRKYDENSIKVLKGPERIRQNMGMYVGGEEQGFTTILKEIIDNAVDESRIAKGKNIFVTLDDDNTVTVADEGRGIPTKNHKDFKNTSTLTVIFTELHAGGKFDAADGATVGTHGVGATATNALSEYFFVGTKVGSGWVGQKFQRGKPASGKPAAIKYAASGAQKNIKTFVAFKPDTQIFKKRKYSADTLRDMIRVQSYFATGITFHFTDPKGKTEKFLSKKGVEDYVSELLAEKKAEAIGPAFSYSDKHMDVSLSWTTLEDELCLSHVSASRTANGGTHVDQLNRVITNAIVAVGGKKVEKIKPIMLRSGMLGVLNVRVLRPAFSSQTKERLVSPEAKALVDGCADALKSFFKKNKELVRQIIERAIAVQDADAAFKLSKKAAAKLNGPRGKTILPEKLATASTKDRSKVELYIVEGDSAAGTGKAARDRSYQEVLALRGKFPNPYKTQEAKIFENKSILSIFQSIGYRPGEGDPLAKMRVGKVILLADADEDGKHINSLLVTLISKYMPQLFDSGLVFVVSAPLYTARAGEKIHYCRTIGEVNKLQEKTRTKLRVSRLKGHGEANADELRDYAFNPTKRKLIKLKPVARADRESIRNIMGEDVSARKILLGIDEAA